jgi:hypothetical protein
MTLTHLKSNGQDGQWEEQVSVRSRNLWKIKHFDRKRASPGAILPLPLPLP